LLALAEIFPTTTDALRASAHATIPPLQWDPAAHLLSRFAFGPTLLDRRKIAASGGGDRWARRNASHWLSHQASLGSQLTGYRGVRGVARHFPLLALSSKRVSATLRANGNANGWDAMDQLSRATIALQIYSPAQLYESLVSFFSDHLNVPNMNSDVWVFRHAYDRDVIRPNAMGTFTRMLLASARHPAMLLYLNVAQSSKAHPNENYARELLELHTVGRHYSQSDVTNAAAIFTGRGVDWNSYAYAYHPELHSTGSVAVLGFSDANSDAAAGEAVGDAFLRHLAAHPLTAQNIAHKICVRFVSDTPSQRLVDAVAHAYLASGTGIMPMVRTLMRSREFWESRGAKVRRPAENLVASIRALGLRVIDLNAATTNVQQQTRSLGHEPLAWPAPNGYPDVASAWRSSGAFVARCHYQLGYASNWTGGFRKFDPKHLYPRPPHTSGDAIDMLTAGLTGQRFSQAHHAALSTLLGEPASTPMRTSVLTTRARGTWSLEQLVGMILHSPHHALR
jgi:hypothetical protein